MPTWSSSVTRPTPRRYFTQPRPWPRWPVQGGSWSWTTPDRSPCPASPPPCPRRVTCPGWSWCAASPRPGAWPACASGTPSAQLTSSPGSPLSVHHGRCRRRHWPPPWRAPGPWRSPLSGRSPSGSPASGVPRARAGLPTPGGTQHRHNGRIRRRVRGGTQRGVLMLEETLAAVRPLDPVSMAAARTLQELATRLAGLAGTCPPRLPQRPAVAVFAGDHGVHAQGVTPWPQEVTAQMVTNFLAGGAVVNAFARQVGASVTVVDVGVASRLDPAERLLDRKVRFGTGDLTEGPAMTRDQALAALAAGIEVTGRLVDAGADLLITGDMGIANTTPAAALIAAFTGSAAETVTGRGTGVDDVTYARKVAVVGAALRRHAPDPTDPVGVLAAVGGLEHAALAGFVLGAAARRTPVVLDGVNAVAAALAAVALAPDAVGAMVAGHRSAEPGAAVALAHLGLTPLIDLGLRLGEGTGALLAVPIVAGAVRVLHEVATFDSAGVSEK